MFIPSILRNRITVRATLRALTTAAAALAAVAAVGSVSPVRARQHEQHHPRPAPAAAQKPGVGAARDYLVQVGKHAMWKSQVAAMHPELAKTAKPLSQAAGTDYLVQVGKTPVRASTLRRVTGPNATRPAPHDAACKDYLVQYGKKTAWASEIGAPCPAGPHKGERRPLCCVAPLEAGKALPPCCKAAQGK